MPTLARCIVDGMHQIKHMVGQFAIGAMHAAGANCVAVIHDMVSKADQIANRMRELTDLANSVGNS